MLENDCSGCREYWLPSEHVGETTYGYVFMIKPGCPVHWTRYLGTLEEIKNLRSRDERD